MKGTYTATITIGVRWKDAVSTLGSSTVESTCGMPVVKTGSSSSLLAINTPLLLCPAWISTVVYCCDSACLMPGIDFSDNFSSVATSMSCGLSCKNCNRPFSKALRIPFTFRVSRVISVGVCCCNGPRSLLFVLVAEAVVSGFVFVCTVFTYSSVMKSITLLSEWLAVTAAIKCDIKTVGANRTMSGAPNMRH